MVICFTYCGSIQCSVFRLNWERWSQPVLFWSKQGVPLLGPSVGSLRPLSRIAILGKSLSPQPGPMTSPPTRSGLPTTEAPGHHPPRPGSPEGCRLRLRAHAGRGERFRGGANVQQRPADAAAAAAWALPLGASSGL